MADFNDILEQLERERLDDEYDSQEAMYREQDIAEERAIQRMEERRQG